MMLHFETLRIESRLKARVCKQSVAKV